MALLFTKLVFVKEQNMKVSIKIHGHNLSFENSQDLFHFFIEFLLMLLIPQAF